jgi:Fe-S oxidoreductase
MCPSFMATREEKDSTRGRANALREALAGHLAPNGPEVIAAMDLCLSCKACKAECPSSVDMAALKAAWLEGRWAARRPPLRTTLFARLPELARRGAGTGAPLLNAFAGRRARRALGLDPDRPLPALARSPFRETRDDGAEASVLLFVDTFARYFEPEPAHAAIRVLDAAGVRVAIAPDVCCGRTLISEGFLDAARVRARALVDALAPHAEAGRAIVGLEPSCLLTLRDEIPRLLPDDPRSGVVARAARTFEEFVAGGGLGGALWSAVPAEALVHPHCHQRALSSAAAGLNALAVAGIVAHDSGAGCCGLAGGWGYEAAHAGVSRAIAEDRLAPAVRALGEDALVVASGFSCRHQIGHVTGRAAVHPAVALADRLRLPAQA